MTANTETAVWNFKLIRANLLIRCLGGGIGRRTGLKILYPSGCAGSIPAPSTKSFLYIMTEETLEHLSDRELLLNLIKEVAEMRKSNDAQFEAVRRGIVDNAIRFDRLEGEIYLIRSEVSHIKADFKELTRKELV